jgi:hypothetical protein
VITTMNWPLVAILLLGAWHGINPGMGWLFAVALGLQEQERRAVWRALLPLAAGHAIAIAAAIAAGMALGLVVPPVVLKRTVALILVIFGVTRLVRASHPRYGGMRMSMRRLTIWSFLMATAHGAGLMVLPFTQFAGSTPTDVARATTAGPVHGEHDASSHATRSFTLHDGPDASMPAATRSDDVASPIGGSRADPVRHGAHAAHFARAGITDAGLVGTIAMIVHTIGYLLATAIVAVIVFEKVGVRMLRTMWVNLDTIWGFALIGTGALTLML